MNERMLKAKLIERGTNVEEVAKAIGMDRATFYRKMKSESFTNKQTVNICNFLKLNHQEIMSIFFDGVIA